MSVVSLSILSLLDVVLEWQDVLAPAGHLAGDADRDQLRQPHEVADLHLSQLQVPVEHAVVETVLEGQRVPLSLLNEHHVVDALTGGVELCSSGSLAHLVQHVLVFVSSNSSLELVEAVSIIELRIFVGVEVTEGINVLATFDLSATGIRQTLDIQ